MAVETQYFASLSGIFNCPVRYGCKPKLGQDPKTATINHKQITINHKQTTINHKQTTINHH